MAENSSRAPIPAPPLGAAKGAPGKLSHAAFIAKDAAATADFYTRILGMPLVHSVIDDRIPSTGDPFPYFHLFFRMGDGSTIAFFIAPGLPEAAVSTHPGYDIFRHFAFQADSPQEVDAWKAHLENEGVKVLGPIDHDGEFNSIYFFDPSGNRLEITFPMEADWNDQPEASARDLAKWCEVITAAEAEGRNIPEALIEYIRTRRAKARDNVVA